NVWTNKPRPSRSPSIRRVSVIWKSLKKAMCTWPIGVPVVRLKPDTTSDAEKALILSVSVTLCRVLALSSVSPRDLLRRSERQRDERQRAVRAPAGGRRRRADDEEVLVIVRAAVAVAHACRGIGSHPASATRMIKVIPFAGVDDPAVARFCQPGEHAQHVRFRRRLPGRRLLVDAML